MAGNTVVFKPAEDTPLCALRFVEILEEAGLPPGVINVVFGNEEAGEAVVRHPAPCAIFFTGSADTGRLIAATCGSMLKKVSLELGGKNGIVVMDDADIELAVEGALWGAFGTAGQRCTASSRLIVSRACWATSPTRSCRALARCASAMGSTRRRRRTRHQRDAAQAHPRVHGDRHAGGAKLLTGGEVAGRASSPRGSSTRRRCSPTCPTMRIAQEEIFGPTTAILPVDSLDDALAAANSTQYRAEPQHLHQRPASRLPRHPRAGSRESSTSMRPPSARRSSFPSAAPRTPATVTVKPAVTCSTSSASGSRSTSITAGACSARRSTPTTSRSAVVQLEERFITHEGGRRSVPGGRGRAATGALPRFPRLG